MKQYILDTRRGIMQEKPLRGKVVGDGIENQREDQCLILVATLKEFVSSEILHPCKKELLPQLK